MPIILQSLCQENKVTWEEILFPSLPYIGRLHFHHEILAYKCIGEEYMSRGTDFYHAASIDQSRALGYCVESSGEASLLGGAGKGRVGAMWVPYEPNSRCSKF